MSLAVFLNTHVALVSFSVSSYAIHSFPVGLIGRTVPLRYHHTWGKSSTDMTKLIKTIILEDKQYRQVNLNSGSPNHFNQQYSIDPIISQFSQEHGDSVLRKIYVFFTHICSGNPVLISDATS
jgi:hypothetical protein